jgi:ABC-type lipoprotein export system ATPase subunit
VVPSTRSPAGLYLGIHFTHQIQESQAGEVVIMTGPSGSGKTTLLSLMFNDIYP